MEKDNEGRMEPPKSSDKGTLRAAVSPRVSSVIPERALEAGRKVLVRLAGRPALSGPHSLIY